MSFFENKYPVLYDIPVKISNGRKSVTSNMTVDSASWSQADSSIADQLDLGKGYHFFEREGVKFWLHKLIIQIGSGRPTTAHIYFGPKELTHTFVKKSATSIGALGWANNGGLSNYIVDLDIKTIKFTDFSYINSLPRPVNPFTIVKLDQPRFDPKWKEEILYNQAPHHFATFIGNKSSDIRVKVDTGSAFTVFEDKYAEELGINIKSGKKITIPSLVAPLILYRHEIVMKIGSLKPEKITVGFGNFPSTILGIDTLYKYKVRFMKDRIMYEDNPSSIW